MFEELIESKRGKPPRCKLNFLLSGILHFSLIATIVLVSSTLPETGVNLQIVFTPSPLAGPVIHRGHSEPHPVNGSRGESPETGMTAPSRIPDKISQEPGLQQASVICNDCEGGDPGSFPGIGNGNENGLPISETGLVLSPPSLPPPVHQSNRPTRPLSVGGDVQNANLISQVKPSYPHPAIVARVQGTVVLEAVISRQGVVEDLRVVSGNPLLVPAALDAVKQWRYRPTLLNGEPVEVETTITVSFTLG